MNVFACTQIEGSVGVAFTSTDIASPTPVQFQLNEEVLYRRFASPAPLKGKIIGSKMRLFDIVGMTVIQSGGSDVSNGSAVYMRSYEIYTEGRNVIHVFEHSLLPCNPRYPKAEWLVEMFCEPIKLAELAQSAPVGKHVDFWDALFNGK